MSNISKVKSFIMTVTTSIIIAICTIYAVINAYLYLFQRNLLYFPVVEMAEPKNYGMYETELVKLTTTDNVEIVAWYTPPKRNEAVMLYLHGNAGNLGDRTEKFKAFTDMGFGMLAVSWRGYGGSGSSPTEQGLYNDARAAIKYLTHNGTELKNIFIYGESLGSGVAVQMAMEYEVKNIVLEAPYTSVANRAAELYPYIPVKLLLKDQFASIDKIGSVRIPVLIFHGYLDEVMPIAHGRRMLEAANEPKEARLFENTGHTDFDFEELAQITYEFVGNVGKSNSQ